MINTVLLLAIPIFVSSAPTDNSVVLDKYHSHDELVNTLKTLADKYDFVKKYDIGRSVEGRTIPCLKFVTVEPRPLLKPMVKFLANMHGDEAVGRELMLALSQYLAENYGKDKRVTSLLDKVEVHIVPTLNPDGFEKKAFFVDSVRGNANGVDLNRAFPTWKDLGKNHDDLVKDREPEVKAAVDWILDNPFVLSVNFHDGAVVANYPWDDRNTKPWERSSLFHPPGSDTNSNYTPDHEEFVSLAKMYASHHSNMYKGSSSCVDSEQFPNGITNGVEWYVVTGGLQDFNYLFSNCMEITVELSCVKKPPEDKLQSEWDMNRDSLLTFLGRYTSLY